MQAQAPAAPATAIAAARAAMNDTVRGASLHVALVTVGQGTDVWERFGHNMLWIRDDRTGESLMWNWGLFDFAQPGFLRRFLFGNTSYRMDSAPSSWEFRRYTQLKRDVIAQDLALTPGQRAALDAFVRANDADSASWSYRYDYFLDNCSTRIRDALDIILGGAIRAALEPQSTELTYRSETLRLNQQDPWLFLGMDLALGAPADRSMTAWQAAFIPMRLRDALRDVRVKRPDGTLVPLVERERVLIVSGRTAELQDFQTVRWPMYVIGATLVLTLTLIGLAALARRRVPAAQSGIVGAAVLVHGVAGLLATFILFMWLFTKHAFWAWNQHFLLMTPLSLAIAVLVWRSGPRQRNARAIQAYHMTMTGIAFAVVIAIPVWYRGHISPMAGLFLAWANMSWMLHLTLGVALAALPKEAA